MMSRLRIEERIERYPVVSATEHVGEHGLAALDRLPPEVFKYLEARARSWAACNACS